MAIVEEPGTTGKYEVIPQGVERPARRQYASHSAPCSLASQVVSWAVVPEPSERTTGMMRRAGRTRPGLSARISGAFHIVSVPVKILVMTSPESRRLVTFLPPIRRLYMKAVPPATIGMYA